MLRGEDMRGRGGRTWEEEEGTTLEEEEGTAWKEEEGRTNRK